MGYYCSMWFNDCVIPADKVDACLEHMNKLWSDEMLLAHAGGGSSRTDVPVRERCWYAWVPNPPEGEYWPTLDKVFEAIGWEFQIDPETGDYHLLFDGGEKLGDEDFLFSHLALYLPDGASMQFRGEDDARWELEVENGTATEYQYEEIRTVDLERLRALEEQQD